MLPPVPEKLPQADDTHAHQPQQQQPTASTSGDATAGPSVAKKEETGEAAGNGIKAENGKVGLIHPSSGTVRDVLPIPTFNDSISYRFENPNRINPNQH